MPPASHWREPLPIARKFITRHRAVSIESSMPGFRRLIRIGKYDLGLMAGSDSRAAHLNKSFFDRESIVLVPLSHERLFKRLSRRKVSEAEQAEARRGQNIYKLNFLQLAPEKPLLAIAQLSAIGDSSGIAGVMFPHSWHQDYHDFLNIAMHQPESSRLTVGEIGYAIFPQFRPILERRGIATLMLGEIEKIAAMHGIGCVVARAEAPNKASLKVLQNRGYVFYGKLQGNPETLFFYKFLPNRTAK